MRLYLCCCSSQTLRSSTKHWHYVCALLHCHWFWRWTLQWVSEITEPFCKFAVKLWSQTYHQIWQLQVEFASTKRKAAETRQLLHNLLVAFHWPIWGGMCWFQWENWTVALRTGRIDCFVPRIVLFAIHIVLVKEVFENHIKSACVNWFFADSLQSSAQKPVTVEQSTDVVSVFS